MALIATYQTDIGYDFHAVPLLFSQTVVNESVTNKDPLEVIPSIILDETTEALDAYCSRNQNLILRRLEVVLTDKTEYRFDIPFRPNQDKWLSLVQQIVERNDITKYRFFGEKINDYLTKLLLSKFNDGV